MLARLVTRGASRLLAPLRSGAASAPVLAWPRAAVVAASHFPPRPLLPQSLLVRSIISVDIHQPNERGSMGDPAVRSQMHGEIARAEEIGMAQFNRLVIEEVNRRCLRPGARRNKRWARHTVRGKRMRAERASRLWRAHKTKQAVLMTWVCRSRRTDALTISLA